MSHLTVRANILQEGNRLPLSMSLKLTPSCVTVVATPIRKFMVTLLQEGYRLPLILTALVQDSTALLQRPPFSASCIHMDRGGKIAQTAGC